MEVKRVDSKAKFSVEETRNYNSNMEALREAEYPMLKGMLVSPGLVIL